MLRETYFRNDYFDGSEWVYNEDEAYVVDGYSIRSLLNYLESDDRIEPWVFSDEAVFDVNQKYLVVVDTVFTYNHGWGTVKVYNLYRRRHNRKHGF